MQHSSSGRAAYTLPSRRCGHEQFDSPICRGSCITMNPSDLAYWPADTAEAVLETTVGSILLDAAAHAPNQTAVVAWGIVPGQRSTWTYAELLRDAERTAQALLSHFEPGEHIAIWAPNLAEWLLLQLGAGLAGIVIVTVNPAYKARELEYVLRQSRAVGLFYIAS